MNSTITFPPARPVLKLTRSSATKSPVAPSDEKWAATLTEERRRLLEDQEALRVREDNLREYESRLRTLQAELEAGGAVVNSSARGSVTPFVRPSSKAPFENDTALQAAWEKLHRARELLEAEQAHLRDDRLNLKEATSALKRREDALALREARLAQREEQFNAALEASIAEQTKAASSPLARFTQAPFAMAKSVFSHSKPKQD